MPATKSDVAAVMSWAIASCSTLHDLRSWWEQHSRKVASLGEPYAGRLTAEKDRRKAELGAVEKHKQKEAMG